MVLLAGVTGFRFSLGPLRNSKWPERMAAPANSFFGFQSPVWAQGLGAKRGEGGGAEHFSAG